MIICSPCLTFQLSVIIPEGVHSIYSKGMCELTTIEMIHTFVLFLISSEVTHSHTGDGTPAARTSDHRPLHEHSPHSAIGITLVLGFVFMFCVEQLVNKHSPGSYSSVTTVEDGPSPPVSRRKSKLTATIGLIVHSAGE